MGRLSVLGLLLLCSLLGAEVQRVEITETRPESANASEQPHPCLSDIHAVLREMSAKLAENRLMIQQLQTLTQEQAAKLREVDTLKQQEVGRVAFTASLATSETRLGPFATSTTLVFKRVISNIGNAYNPNSGLFIAPVKGAYHFEVYIHGYPDNSKASAAKLMKNEEGIVSAYAIQQNGAYTPSTGATLLLEAGDVVSVRSWPNCKIYDNDNGHTSFSGHLLFLM